MPDSRRPRAGVGTGKITVGGLRGPSPGAGRGPLVTPRPGALIHLLSAARLILTHPPPEGRVGDSSTTWRPLPDRPIFKPRSLPHQLTCGQLGRPGRHEVRPAARSRAWDGHGHSDTSFLEFV